MTLPLPSEVPVTDIRRILKKKKVVIALDDQADHSQVEIGLDNYTETAGVIAGTIGAVEIKEGNPDSIWHLMLIGVEMSGKAFSATVDLATMKCTLQANDPGILNILEATDGLIDH